MDKFDFSKLNWNLDKMNPLLDVNRGIVKQNENMEKIAKEVSDSRNEEIERQKRNNELLELNAEQNKQLIRLSEIEASFLENISEDTSNLVNLLKNLEHINKTNGTITKENMLIIQQRLDQIIANASPANINQLFLEEVKKQIVEKGVSFGLQFFITGLKALFATNNAS